jgi:hypothetical protein
VSQKRDQTNSLMRDMKKKRNKKTLANVYFLLLTRSMYYAASNIYFSSSPDVEEFHINKTLGKARAEKDTSLPQDNGHKQHLCVTIRFTICNQFIRSFCFNNVISVTLHHNTYRQVRIFTLTSNKKSLSLDYSKDTLYEKPNEIPAKVIAQRTTG